MTNLSQISSLMSKHIDFNSLSTLKGILKIFFLDGVKNLLLISLNAFNEFKSIPFRRNFQFRKLVDEVWSFLVLLKQFLGRLKSVNCLFVAIAYMYYQLKIINSVLKVSNHTSYSREMFCGNLFYTGSSIQ